MAEMVNAAAQTGAPAGAAPAAAAPTGGDAPAEGGDEFDYSDFDLDE